MPEQKNRLLLVVMDGVGWTDLDHGNVVKHAYIPTLTRLTQTAAFRTLRAHGTAVGLPSDEDMGNSEVGHNAIGCGQIYAQGACLVNDSIATGALFQSPTWNKLISEIAPNGTLHLLGLLSDGNVHSHVDHVKALIHAAKKAGVKRLALHALSDGRDVGAQTALVYIDDMEAFMATQNSNDFRAFFASGGGRMVLTMDRYEADWSMVERGWQTHVLGQAQNFGSAREAVEFYRNETPDLSDQYVPAWVVAENGKALAPIEDGDAVIFFNFRGDRALEISRAFEEKETFKHFDRVRVPKVFYAGMLEYDGDLHIPSHYLVSPPQISATLTEELIKYGINEYAVSETQKYGHVTYFWNGNRTEKFSEKLETYEEVPSDVLSFDLKPWMKAYEVTEKVIAAMATKNFDFIRCNYPNGDMVGHTGNYQASVIALETVDLALGRLVDACDHYGYTLMILADHGNCDEMYQPKKKADAPNVPKTSHSLAPVPFIVYGRDDVEMAENPDFGLANVAASVTELLGLAPNPAWEPAACRVKR